MRRSTTILAATVGVVAVALPAWAYYVSNTVSRTFTAASLSAAVSPIATPNATPAVTVSWTLPASQLTGAQYVVTRTTGNLAVCTVASTVTSCPDPNAVAASTTYTYAIKTVLPGTTWTTTSQSFSATTPAATLTFSLTTTSDAAIGTQAAGTSFTMKVRAMNGASVATGYTGPKSVTFTGPATNAAGSVPTVNGTAVGTATSVTFSAGVATVPVVLTKTGSTTITATEGTTTGSSNAFTVNTGAANRLAFTSVSGIAVTTNCTLGCTYVTGNTNPNISAKVSVTDSVGNQVSNLGAPLSFTVTRTGGGTFSNGPMTIPASGLAESTTSFTFTNGSSNYSATITAPTTGGFTSVVMNLSKNP